MQEVPKVGEFYHFWDDGKTSPSRHYICKIERIVNLKEAAEIMVDYFETKMSLVNAWKRDANQHDWLMAKETDVLIEISCPKYDDEKLWAARTKDGGWFTMNIQSSWQGGRVDVEGKIYESALEYAMQIGLDTELYTKETY